VALAAAIAAAASRPSPHLDSHALEDRVARDRKARIVVDH